MIRSYRGIFTVPGTAAFSTAAFVGRLPVAMLGLGIVLLFSSLPGAAGSYRDVGAVAAATMLGYAAAAPAAGRLADRHGQRGVLLASAALHFAGLTTLMALARPSTPLWALCLAGAVTGASRPSTGTMVRTRWAHVLARPGVKPAGARLETAFSFEAVLDETAFIAGPVLVTALATGVHRLAGLACCLVLTVGGACALALQRGSEPPPRRGREDTGSALAVPGMLVITAVACAAGCVVGMFDIVVVARSAELGSRALAGPMLAVLAVGSMIGGLWYGARSWAAPPHLLWIRALGAQVVGLLPLVVARDVWSLALSMFVAGLTVTPIGISGLVLVERLLPPGLLTEGMSVENTAMALGVAGGGWLAGALADALGPGRALALPAGAACVAFSFAALGARRLTTPVPEPARAEVSG
ncbi:MFS transporter [Streptomyces sp. NPDC053079]|uniref:MFS transporter n=1 Tax=Streptomyces sp. NPDC053079 TaxID=3365697 RepID=UPI0037CDB8B5